MNKLISNKRALAIVEKALVALALLGATFHVWCSWAGLPERLAPLGIVAMTVFLFLSLMSTTLRRIVPSGNGTASERTGTSRER